MSIDHFDKLTVRSLRADIKQALKSVEQRHGITVDLGNARFTDTQTTYQLKLIVTDPLTGTPQTAEREAFINNAEFFGLDPSWLDQTFLMDGEQYKIRGLKTTARRYQVQVTRTSDGKHFKMSSKMVRREMV